MNKKSFNKYKSNFLTTLVISIILIIIGVLFIPLSFTDRGEFLLTSLEAIICYISIGGGLVFLIFSIINLFIYKIKKRKIVNNNELNS